MQIHGFQTLTLLDYPEHIAATVFTGGCNFRCPFCQNADLVIKPGGQTLISEEEVLAVLDKRRGKLQGVCVTGGEPTLQYDLADFIRKIKKLGYLVKLDTNGYCPEVLEELLRENLLDYVAMDIKASLTNYEKVAGCQGIDLEKIQKSIALLRKGKVLYEFRTTVVKGLHTLCEFEEIGKLLKGAPLYCLQSYRESERVLGLESGMEMGTFSREEMETAVQIVKPYVGKVVLRGVE